MNLNTLVQTCQHVNALKAFTQHLSSAITVIKAIENNSNSRSHTLPQKRCFPPNKNADEQLRFFSTKKRKVASTHLSKPSYTGSQQCKSHLLSIDTTFWGVCLQDDNCSKDELVDWVQCTTCKMWIHLVCAHCENSLDTTICSVCTYHVFLTSVTFLVALWV